MTQEDLRTFCTALGLTAVVIKHGKALDGKTRRTAGSIKPAADLLIEASCLRAANQDGPQQIDQEIEQLKADLRLKGEADMHKDRDCLFRLYNRLCQRSAIYASDDTIADRLLELLDAEIERDNKTPPHQH